MSLALYRKYRPATLDEVIGQDHVTEPLKRALANDRVHHAYLFSGPRGCGKTSSARILARSLNCVEGPTPNPCGVCNSCVDLAPTGGGSIDVIELGAATHGLVDDARDLREKAVYAPAASRYKIYIIDEAHQLGSGAANALLKVVEEPPEHVRFVFATTEPDKIIGTIRSRTHHYGFRLVPSRTLQAHLAKICDSEGYQADPGALALVSRAAGGSVRDSLSILGQLLAGSGPEGLTYDEAANQLGVTDSALVDEVVTAMAARDGAAMFRLIDSVVETGHDPRRFVTDLLERIRDLIVVAGVPDAGEVGLIDGPAERVEELRQQSALFTPGDLSRDADLVSKGLTELKGATAPRLQLELLAARIVLPAPDTSDLTARIARLEAGQQPVGRQSVAQTPARPAPKAPSAATRTNPEESSDAEEPLAKAMTEASTPSTSERSSQVAPPTSIESSKRVPSSPPASPPVATRSNSQTGPPPKLSSIAPTTSSRPAAPEESPKSGEPGTESSVPGENGRPPFPSDQRQQPSPNRTPEPAHEATPSPTPEPAPNPSGEVSLEQVRALWPTILEEVKSVSRVVWMLFLDSHPVSVDGDIVVANHDNIGTVKRYNQSSAYEEKVAAAASKIVGKPLRVQLVNGEVPAGAVSDRSASDRRSARHETRAADSNPDADVSDSTDVDEVAGIELLERELGGVKVTEYDEN